MKKIILPFAMAVLGGLVVLTADHLIFKKTAPLMAATNSPATRAVNYIAPAGTIDFHAAAESSVQSVVHVMTKTTTQQTYYDPFQGFFGGNGVQVVPREQDAYGSGVIITSDGYIVTNNHVVAGADQIQVVLNDKRTYDATVVGTDPNTDLAVLKIDEKDLPFLAYGNSDDVVVGDWVLAVGNPFNLTSTVTAGIVSAKARNIDLISSNGSGSNAVESFIQTDAAVNPGNSGGALVNTSGQLVGINSAIASSTGSFAGYSFAIPVNLVKKVVADIMEFGMVERGYLGVNIKDVDATLAKDKNLDVLKGVYVESVIDGGSSADAGIEAGEVITKVGDVEVDNVSELQEQINRFRPGDKVVLTYLDGSKEKSATVTLKNKNNETSLLKKNDLASTAESLGATFETVASEDLAKLNITNGLRVSKLDAGKLRNAGIREGFIITSVDKNPVSTPEDLKSVLDNKKGGILIEGVYPNGSKAYYAFGM
ncbi:MAG TPA: trypsin-like peptidase domain-containing protein [Bacteroidia bacterium]|jgi:Do/DeqQ family serine protease|nr:trypsin-like peptidase domain-containing protein [Bacteroidia bacterium]